MYVYKDDTPAEDMTARDHYIKASLYAAEASDQLEKIQNKLSSRDIGMQQFDCYIALAEIHTRLAANDINGGEELP
jgi:hypothetical protein